MLAVVAGVALWGWLKPVPPESRVVSHFSTPLTLGPPNPTPIAFSRDGSRLAYVAGFQSSKIYVREMDRLEAKPLDGTDGAMMLSFSPDGQWITYISSLAPPVRLRKVAISGGPVQNLAEFDRFTAQSWADDDNIYLASSVGLQRIPSTGGKPELLLAADKELYDSPQLLPGGRKLLFSIQTNGTGFQSAVLDLKSREKRIVLENAPGHAHYAQGHLVYYVFTSGTLMALPFDLDRLTTRGSPAPVLEQVQVSIGPHGPYAFSDSGTLAYFGGTVIPVPVSTVVWVDRKGAETALPAPPQRYGSIRVSPMGTRAAIAIAAGEGLTVDLWVYDLIRGGNPSRVTFDGSSALPAWSADSKRLLYFYFKIPHYEIRSVPADNSGMPVTLYSGDNEAYVPDSASLDGKALIGTRATPNFVSAAWQMSLTDEPGKAKPQPLLDPRPTKTLVQFSPDSKWIAYSSSESGHEEVYVVPYPDSGGRSQVSLEGGRDPHWAHNGHELFFRNGDKLMVADVQNGRAAGTPRALFEKPYPEYDVDRDDNKFLMLKPVAGQQGALNGELHVIVNWFTDLAQRVPVK
jgi:serine/threonine-protein kinase